MSLRCLIRHDPQPSLFEGRSVREPLITVQGLAGWQNDRLEFSPCSRCGVLVGGRRYRKGKSA